MRLYRDQPSGTVDRARSLRRNATDAEQRLLRGLKEAFPHLKWRRQVPFGPYYADLLCFGAKVVIEVDGGLHAEAAEYDASRTRFLERDGWHMLRFWNNDVMGNLEGVIEQISLSLREREGARRMSGGKGKGGVSTETTSPSPFRAVGAPSLSLRERER